MSGDGTKQNNKINCPFFIHGLAQRDASYLFIFELCMALVKWLFAEKRFRTPAISSIFSKLKTLVNIGL